MNANLLIDQIVRQTTVLIAQLSVASGLRAPVAHVAGQTFLQLAREIESQGVSRKVVADMFGMALRSYQRKVQRLGEDADAGKTLWYAVIAYLEEHGPVPRGALLDHFKHKDEVVVIAVLNDLVSTGLAYKTGRGEGGSYGVMPNAEVQKMIEREEADALEGFVWLSIFHEPGKSEASFHGRFGDRAGVGKALEVLVADGRVRRIVKDGETTLDAGPFMVEVGAPKGWEAAVFDHFMSVTAALVVKLRSHGPRSADGDRTGGTTVHFGIHEEHPLKSEVLETLARTRQTVHELLGRVTAHNREHPVPEDERMRVTFYFGQYVVEPGSMIAEATEEA